MIDLTGSYEGECCFAYRVLRYEVKIFGALVIEPVFAWVYRKIYRTNYVNMIKSREQWENLTEQDIDKLIVGGIQVDVGNVEYEK